MDYKPLPIGIDDFKKLISEDYYYVDKTLFIKELLDKKGEANLFTRPRRFGKTLNMSMLRYFFENNENENINAENRELFNGLAIMSEGEKYLSHMQKYPVIFLSLKGAKQPTWELSYTMLKRQIAAEFVRHHQILDKLSPFDQERFSQIEQ